MLGICIKRENHATGIERRLEVLGNSCQRNIWKNPLTVHGQLQSEKTSYQKEKCILVFVSWVGTSHHQWNSSTFFLRQSIKGSNPKSEVVYPSFNGSVQSKGISSTSWDACTCAGWGGLWATPLRNMRRYCTNPPAGTMLLRSKRSSLDRSSIRLAMASSMPGLPASKGTSTIQYHLGLHQAFGASFPARYWGRSWNKHWTSRFSTFEGNV